MIAHFLYEFIIKTIPSCHKILNKIFTLRNEIIYIKKYNFSLFLSYNIDIRFQ